MSQRDKPRPEKAASTSTEAGAATSSTAVISMTGYGRAVVEDGQRVTAEVRSVNGRFLKLSVKVAGRYGALEDRVKSLLAEQGVRRGSIDVNLFFDNAAAEEAGSFGIDSKAVNHYLSQAGAILRKRKSREKVPLSALLSLPGVVKRQEPDGDVESAWTLARKALLAALGQFNVMREREGGALAADIRQQLDKLAEHRAAILAAAPEALKSYIPKFKERVARLLEQAGTGTPLSPGALEREIVMMADRADVSEELARLGSHFEQMRAALDAGGETGKKLDFMTQELLRETNTIGSKTQDERVTYRVVEMKGLIEKIREQVQNLE